MLIPSRSEPDSFHGQDVLQHFGLVGDFNTFWKLNFFLGPNVSVDLYKAEFKGTLDTGIHGNQVPFLFWAYGHSN